MTAGWNAAVWGEARAWLRESTMVGADAGTLPRSAVTHWLDKFYEGGTAQFGRDAQSLNDQEVN